MLDVGGHPGFWISQPPLVGNIDTLNVYPVEFDSSAYPDHRIRTVVGNGCALPLKDKSYDIAFSNSVIEHVGEWKNQVAFASEIRRVGNAVWVQTPARECPIEPHYLAPFIHWFPPSFQRRLLRHFTPWGWISKPSPQEVDRVVDTTRLIRYREMKELFPDCEIYVEKFLLWLPKSYIAIRKKE